MQRLFVKPADGPFEALDPEQVEAAAHHHLIWLDLEAESPETVDATCARLGFPTGTVQQDIDDYLLPRIRENEESIHLVLQTPVTGEDGRLDAAQIDVLIGNGKLLTIHRDARKSVSWLSDLSNLNGSPTNTAAELAAALAQVVGRQVLPLLHELELRIDSLEDLAFTADPRVLTEVQALRRDVLMLRHVAGPQRDVMEDLSKSPNRLVGENGRRAFRTSYDHSVRVVESLESARSLLNSVLETYRGAVADQTNEIVRLLTVFSAILLPLTLIAGVFGMNFDFIPTGDETWGFWVMVGSMTVLAVSLWLYFGKRGFVGGPRLRELPKAVGLGLFQVGAAPVRAIASGVGSTLHHLDPRKGQTPPNE